MQCGKTLASKASLARPGGLITSEACIASGKAAERSHHDLFG